MKSTAPDDRATQKRVAASAETFLATFGLKSLHDLPDREHLADAGLTGP